MRIVLDKALCAGHARCHALEPGLFPLDDLGYADVTEVEVPAGEATRAHRVTAACPERALAVVEHSQA